MNITDTRRLNLGGRRHAAIGGHAVSASALMSATAAPGAPASDATITIGPCNGNATPAVVVAAAQLKDGGFCTGANLWPRSFKSLYLAAKADDIAKVRELQRFTTLSSSLLYSIGSGQSGFVKGVKAALAEMGLVKNVLATPFTPFEGKELESVRKMLGKLFPLQK